MACFLLPIYLNLKSENDFNEIRLKSILTKETVTICGIEKDTLYEDIKAKIIQVLPHLSESNVLIVDLSALEELKRDDGPRCFVTDASMRKNFQKSITIIIVCKEKLHRVIKKFGVEVLTPEKYIHQYQSSETI